jgi:folate-binding protein YgfZ
MSKMTLLPDRAVIEVSGEDRVGYLQGLVSNDVTLAAPGRAVWAALLTPQGKWVADLFIHNDGGRLLLDIEAAQAAMLVQKLTRFRLRAKVAVAPVPLLVHAGWNGPAPDGAVPDPRLPAAGWRLLSDHPLPATATPDEYDLHRLRLGLPGGSLDMESEKTTLLEANFDALNGVSWTKGCYMGQELTARTKYRGLLKRHLMPVRVDGPLPASGTPVFAADTEVGVMRSGRDGRGLALLRNDAAGSLRCGEAALMVELPEWMATAPP